MGGGAEIKAVAYAERMPTVPGLGTGLVPIAQMVILPPMIFRIVTLLGRRKAL
jgi:hypothetical protein